MTIISMDLNPERLPPSHKTGLSIGTHHHHTW